MKISILFATYNRDDVLSKSLDGYKHLELEGISLDIVVVDNACRSETKSIVTSYQELPIRYVECSTPGKNAALNAGLTKIRGDYVILTDDDTIPCAGWVKSYYQGFITYPDIKIFGGAIVPDLQLMPQWIDINDPNIRGALGILELADKDKEVNPTDIWGGNMAINADLFSVGDKFNESIGPNGETYVMGSETEFLNRFRQKGYSAMYLFKATVAHQIRQNQLTMLWLKQRGNRQGKGIAHQRLINNVYEQNVTKLFGVPRFMLIAYIKDKLKLTLLGWLLNKKEYTSQMLKMKILEGELQYLKQNQNQNQK